MNYHLLPLYINPIAFHLGSFNVTWYAISYLLAFSTLIALVYWRTKQKELGQSFSFSLDAILWAGIGLLLGARIGYVLLYNFGYYFNNPASIFWPFYNGNFIGLSGMSFHGGLVGAIIVGLVYAKIKKVSFISLVNDFVPAIPLAYFWGRIGNFLGGELYGQKTDSALGMYFPDNPQVLRHPSQLYEALGEGILIFLILWPIRNNPRFKSKLFAFYLILYGIIRFMIEFFRQPDPQIGLVLLSLTIGQLLCFGMIVVGIVLVKTKPKK